MFTLSLLIFDLSCKKEVVGQSQTTLTNGIVVYLKQNNSQWEVWKVNYDGTSKSKINFVLPSGFGLYGDSVIISPDGKTLFIKLVDTNNKQYLYSSNIDGTNLKQIDSSNVLTIGGCN